MRKLVIVPTYNEKENIPNLLAAILALEIQSLEILVVDDSSPDGTGDIVKSLGVADSRIHLLTRAQKQGLGRAYLAGFQWGLEKQFDILVEMDADFSHRPQDLKILLSKLTDGDSARSLDFAIGSRYVPGGSTVNWGLGRKIISRGGSLYSRIILGYPINDWTGGFVAWKSTVLKGISLDQVKSNGYSFQIEMKYRALKAGFKGQEVAIVFEDRRVGKSKMSSKIVFEALYKVWMIRMTPWL